MTLYRHCDVSHLSLDNKECAIFIVLNKTQKIFGMPLFGTFDETNGSFLISKEQIQISYEITKPEIQNINDEIDEYDLYSLGKHENLLLSPHSKNNLFSTFVILKSVFDELGTNSQTVFIKEYEDEIFEQLMSYSEIKSLFYQSRKIIPLEKRDEFFKDDALNHIYIDKDSDFIFELFSKEKNETNMFKVIDLVKKHEPVKIIITEPVDQPSINYYLSKTTLNAETFIDSYLCSMAARIALQNQLPRITPNVNLHKQGASTKNAIDFYRSVIKGLEKHDESSPFFVDK